MLAVLAELLEQGHRGQDLYDAPGGVSYKVLPRLFAGPSVTDLLAVISTAS